MHVLLVPCLDLIYSRLITLVCCALLYVHFSFAIILMGKRELVALRSLFSWCLVIAVWLFLVVLWVCMQFVIVVFPDHTHLLFSKRDRFVLLYSGRCPESLLLPHEVLGWMFH